MGTRLSGKLTILVLRSGGRAPLQISIPKWLVSLVHSCALTFFGVIGFYGWQMQGWYGLTGQTVQYLGLPEDREHWGLFELVSPARLGPTRAELRDLMSKQRAARLGLGDRKAASALLTGVVAPEWSQEALANGDLGDGTLRWPVHRGYFGRGYGSGQGGYHLAVDINGEMGSDVYAAAPGIVGYVGSDLRGYGNVVLVVHPGGWVTLYGHNKRVIVHAGERVRQGQQLAELGSSGRSDGPHVHFELIYQGKNCDPLPFVQPTEVDHLSAAGPIKQERWDLLKAKPSTVRCKRRMMHPVHEDDDERMVGANERKAVVPPG